MTEMCRHRWEDNSDFDTPPDRQKMVCVKCDAEKYQCVTCGMKVIGDDSCRRCAGYTPGMLALYEHQQGAKRS